MSDGVNVLPLATSQDHKRLRDGDEGPNTGGMGAYSPAPIVTPKIHARVMREIIQPAVQGMAQEGMPYTGFLYAGLMIDTGRQPARARVQLPTGRPRSAAHPAAAQVRPARSARARRGGSARPGRGPLGSASGARGGARRARLSGGSSPRRCDYRHSRACRKDCRVFHAGTRLEGKALRDERRPRPVRNGAGRLGAHGANARIRGRGPHPLRRHAIPQGHRQPRPQAAVTVDAAPVEKYFAGLQEKIIAARSKRSTAVRSSATHGRAPKAAAARAACSKRGTVFERAGVNFSEVRGHALAALGERAAAAACRDRPGRQWACRSCCILAIPIAQPSTSMCASSPREETWWFGGGMDLTPCYGFEDDARHFHRSCREALEPFGADYYPRFKAWCDRYFHLPHRGEARGIGGIFFDDFAERDFDFSFRLTQAVGDAFLPAYLPIVERRRADAVRRARARISALPARALRRVQSRSRPRHALRPAVGRPHRIDTHVASAARGVALRLGSGARLA